MEKIYTVVNMSKNNDLRKSEYYDFLFYVNNNENEKLRNQREYLFIKCADIINPNIVMLYANDLIKNPVKMINDNQYLYFVPVYDKGVFNMLSENEMLHVYSNGESNFIDDNDAFISAVNMEANCDVFKENIESSKLL